MPKMIISLEGVVIREVQLIKDVTTIGRRPYNDVVLDNPAVSGEHAVVQLKGHQVYIEDLQSTNGTYVNGASIAKALVQVNDIVEVARYQIRFLARAPWPGTALEGDPAPYLRVLLPVGHDRQMSLVKPVTTFGKPGLVVAAISRRGQMFMLSRVEGAQPLFLNGQPVISGEPVPLKNQDIFELAGTRLQFFLP